MVSSPKLQAGRHTNRCTRGWTVLHGSLWLCAGNLAATPPPPRIVAWEGKEREAKYLAPEPVRKSPTEDPATFWSDLELPQDDPMFLDADAFGRNTSPVMISNGSGSPVQMSLPEWDLPRSMYTYVRSMDDPCWVQVLSWKKCRSLRIEAGAKLHLGISFPALRHFQFTFADGNTEIVPICFHPPAGSGARPPEQCLGLEVESKGETRVHRSKDF